jgi:glycosyltransferase involved in cell wall biosynthesis
MISVFTCSVSRAAGGLHDSIKGFYKAIQRIDEGQYKNLRIFSFEDEFSSLDKADWLPLGLQLFKKANFFFYSSSASKEIVARPNNFLHIHGLWRYPHAFASKWRLVVNKETVVSPHGMLDPYILQNQSFLKKKIGDILFAKRAFKSIDYYHALSIKEYEDIRSYGITKPVAIIPNGVNIPDSNLEFKKEDSKRHLLFLGRLHPKKGVDILLNAIAKLQNEFPELLGDWVVDIVGWAEEEFDKKLFHIVNTNSLHKIVKFHGGVFGKRKDELYQASDWFILPSYGEGLPMTVLEAWSWKVPVIMTRNCNIPEGFASNAAIEIETTVESVYNSIKRVISMTENERLLISMNGYELVKEKFSWEKSGNSMHLFYNWIKTKQEKPDFVHL